MPGCIESYQFCIYFPTAGKDDAFVDVLAVLSIHIKDLHEERDDCCPIFIGGDANVSSKNPTGARRAIH